MGGNEGDMPGLGDNAENPHAPGRTLVHAATVKLPAFYASAPKFWFGQAESQFRLKKIMDDLTKFDHMMSVLSEDVVLQVVASIEDQSYTSLKAALMEVFELSSSQRAVKLLHLP